MWAGWQLLCSLIYPWFTSSQLAHSGCSSDVYWLMGSFLRRSHLGEPIKCRFLGPLSTYWILISGDRDQVSVMTPEFENHGCKIWIKDSSIIRREKTLIVFTFEHLLVVIKYWSQTDSLCCISIGKFPFQWKGISIQSVAVWSSPRVWARQTFTNLGRGKANKKKGRGNRSRATWSSSLAWLLTFTWKS